MTTRAFIPALLVAFVLPAVAGMVAAEADEVLVRPAPQRAGDVYRYASGPAGGDARATDILAYEGTALVPDRYGRLVGADAFHREIYHDGALVHASRCHALAGGHAAVRHETLAGPGNGMGMGHESFSSTLGVTTRESASSWSANFTVVFPDDACREPAALPPGPLREGDRLRAVDLFPELAGTPGADVPSAPAEAATFHGRHALRFVFDAGRMYAHAPGQVEGAVSVLLADELPVAAETAVNATSAFDGQTVRHRGVRALEGITLGDGPARPPYAGEEPAPFEGRLVAFAPAFLRDEGFDLPYPYAEAFEALRSDPTLAFGRLVAQNPDAMLVQASYDRDRRPARAGAFETDGGWRLLFFDGRQTYSVETVRARADAGPLAVPVVENQEHGASPASPPPGLAAPPARVPGGEALARVVAAHGLEPATIRWLEFDAWRGAGNQGQDPLHAAGHMLLSDVSPEAVGAHAGRTLVLDSFDGGARAVGRATQNGTSSSLLGPLAGGGSLQSAAPPATATAAAASSFAPVERPPPGAGLAARAAVAAAATTGVALLLFAAKLLLAPLYTRLVRHRLLDNDVRARLHERVRRDPGISQAELVEFAGVGEGAARRHLGQLLRHGFLVEVRDGARVGYYVAGELPPAVARRVRLLRGETARRVYELYAAEPGASLRAAAARLGMSAPGVHRAKKKLEKAGLLPARPETTVALQP